MNNQTLLILGSSGFIGSYLFNFFKNHLKTYGLQKNPNKNSMIIASDLKLLNSIHFPSSPKVIINCATPNNNSFLNYQNIESELRNRAEVIEQFLDSNEVDHIINFSTIQVYGTELNGVYSKYSPIKIESDYANLHHLNENLFYKVCNKKNTVFTNLRLSNVVGLPDFDEFNRYSLVPFCFLDSAFREGRIELKSSGKQMRNYILLSEIATFIFSLLNKSTPTYKANTYNLVSKRFLKIIDIAIMFKDVMYELYNHHLSVIPLSEFPLESNQFLFEDYDEVNNLLSYDGFQDILKDIIKSYKSTKDLNVYRS